MNYSIIIPSHNIKLANVAKEYLNGFDVEIFDGKNYPSYAKLINDCILHAKNEIVIIVNHKIRANAIHIYKLLELINKGYGLVCLQNFHFYGFKKDLIRKIGFFDERFIGGEYEDEDILRRLIENNIAFYFSAEVPEIFMNSSWNNIKAKEFFYKKWKDGKIERLIPDEKYEYYLGPYEQSEFLTLKHTIFLQPKNPLVNIIKKYNELYSNNNN